MSKEPFHTKISTPPQPAKRGRGRPRKYGELPEGADLAQAFAGVPKNGAYKHLTPEQLASRRAYDALRQRGRSKSGRIRHRNSPAGALPAGQPTTAVGLAVQPAPAPAPAPVPVPATVPTATAAVVAPAPEVPADDGLLPVEREMLEVRRRQGLV